MNFTTLLKKTTFIFLLIFCFVISFSGVEAERSIRLRKTRSHIAPKHISRLARSGSGIYARKYSYGRPIPNYSTKGTVGRNRRNFRGRRNRRTRTYASGYGNYTPNRNYSGGRNSPRIDHPKIGPHKKRKEQYPLVKEPHYGSIKQKRRIRPHRFNPIQKPLPPKKINDFDEEYFFPEEGKRGEGKYEYENRFPRPKKKRKNPGEVKKPEFISKPFYFDESGSRDRPISYSTFIQHPSGSHDEVDGYYEESDYEHYSQPVVKTKKKRVKKKTTSSKKKNKDEDYYKPFVFEKEKPEYSPGYTDEYEFPVKSTKKQNKLKPLYEVGNDEDFVTNKHLLHSKPRPQVSNIFRISDSNYDNFRGSTKVQESSQFNPSYSQSWSSVVETTARPVQYQTENGFQPQQSPSQYNYQKDYSSLLKTKTVATNTQQSSYYSQPDNTYKNLAYNNNYVSNQVSATNSQIPNYNYKTQSSSVYPNQPAPTYSQPAPTYSQPAPTYSQLSPSSSTFLSDITVQKSVPIYDNTETFYNFNNNAYVNSQSSKYFDADSQKYSNRLSSYRNGEKSDDEFIKKHQNLYNNGLSGVPVQGDGYAKDSTVKKDYDIGYGDFQFDENPSS